PASRSNTAWLALTSTGPSAPDWATASAGTRMAAAITARQRRSGPCTGPLWLGSFEFTYYSLLESHAPGVQVRVHAARPGAAFTVSHMDGVRGGNLAIAAQVVQLPGVEGDAVVLADRLDVVFEDDQIAVVAYFTIVGLDGPLVVAVVQAQVRV